jgi:hypothetical protein
VNTGTEPAGGVAEPVGVDPHATLTVAGALAPAALLAVTTYVAGTLAVEVARQVGPELEQPFHAYRSGALLK